MIKVKIWLTAFFRVGGALLRSAFHYLMLPVKVVWFIINWVLILVALPFAFIYAILKSVVDGKWKV